MDLNLKKASQDEGIKYLESLKRSKKYSSICELIRKHGDADSLLISRYALEKLS